MSRNANVVTVKAVLSKRHLLLAKFPKFTIKLQRILYPGSSTVSTIEVATGQRPHVRLGLASAANDDTDDWFGWTTNIRFTPLPVLEATLLSKPLPGDCSAKIHLQRDIRGAALSVMGFWNGADGLSVGFGTSVSSAGPVTSQLLLDLSGNRLFIPVILTYDVDWYIGLCALLAPSAIGAASYYFLIKPWLRTQRISKSRELRRLLREQTEQRRIEAQETVTMLSRHAHRQTEHERGIGGLVILTATYETSGEDEAEAKVIVDVTIPLQAQVRESQLMIPGGRSKADLLGFYDPSPGARKRLKIEYLFHGALHVVEVGDFSGVLLPQRVHLVV